MISNYYFTKTGDTFETIARKVYGTELEAQRLRDANPGAYEPFPGVQTLTVPAVPDAPRGVPGLLPVPIWRNASRPARANMSRNAVTVYVDGKQFRYWTEIQITMSLDSISTMSFTAPFNSRSKTFRDTFKPLSYKNLEVTVGNVPFFTGTMVNIDTSVETDAVKVAVASYAWPGVLNDCTAPAGTYGSLDFRGVDLKEIATKLAGIFGIRVEFKADPGPRFEVESLPVGETILRYLSKLAKTRNLIISSTPEGALLFLRPVLARTVQELTPPTAPMFMLLTTKHPPSPVARLKQGVPPLTAISPSFSTQEYYSHVTGMQGTIAGIEGKQYTVTNDDLRGVVRPYNFVSNSYDSAELEAEVKAKAGRMLGSSVSYAVSVATWRDSKGRLWEPNTLITLKAPDAMVYKEYTFILRNVVFSRNSTNDSAVLTLVLPGSFSGEMPRDLPWDG